MTPVGLAAAGAAAAWLVVVCPVPAWAQAGSSPAPAVEFLPRTAFHLTAEHLSGDDERYVWEANFGGELDIVDYGKGRFTFQGNYQAILGEERRVFDPNQGNYVLAGSLSFRRGATEIAGVLYHQSRHLSDRAKQDAIDWNMIGGRVRHVAITGGARLDARADLRAAFLKSNVDYSWELDSLVRADLPLRSGVGVMAAGGVRRVGVDGTRNRGDQTGFRAEGGVRFEGRSGAIELFAAVERRIDPYPLDAGTARWVTAGFRLLGQSSGR